MRWLIGRELIVIVRCRGFWAAVATQVALLSAFVVVWGAGLPVQGASTPIQQFIAAQMALSSVLLPWTGLRCSVPSGRNGLAAIAMATAIRPSIAVLARCAALGVGLTVVTATSLPLTVVMQQVSARPLPDVLPALLPLAGVSAFAAVSATISSLVFRSRLVAWMVATLATVSIVALPPTTTIATMALVAALCAAILASRWAYANGLYLSEEPPVRGSR